jgi:hypothetical protein
MGFAALKLVGTLIIATRVYIDTTPLTNVGRIRLGDEKEPRLGDACITGIFGVTPVVTPWDMSVVTAVFNGKLHLGLTYRPPAFRRRQPASPSTSMWRRSGTTSWR